MELLGIEISLEKFDRLICEQNKGKELVIENGKVIAREIFISEEKKIEKKICELENWFNEFFDKQIIQSVWQEDYKVSRDNYFKDDMGNYIEYYDIDELKQQANKVRKELKDLKLNKFFNDIK